MFINVIEFEQFINMELNKHKHKKEILAIDIDETLFDLIPILLIKSNNKYKDNVKYKDITDYDIHKFLKPECKNIFEEFLTDEIFERLVPKRYSQYALEILSNIYNIYFLTAGHFCTGGARDILLNKYFGDFYKSNMLVMCKDKYLFKCNILIDDYQKNLFKMPNDVVKIMPLCPWNIDINTKVNGIIGVDDWLDILKVLISRHFIRNGELINIKDINKVG